jgi:hypothetical protein
MTKNVLIYNSQAAGDCLLGTHTARLYKKLFPESTISFVTREGLVPTTSENEMFTKDLHSLIYMQESIDYVGQVINTAEGPKIQLFDYDGQIDYDEIIHQHSWFSDLGIVRSQSAYLFEKYGREHFEDTETVFNVNRQKELPTEYLNIGISGPLDWNRKTFNEKERTLFLRALTEFLKSKNINAKITLLGKDVETGTLVDSMRKLNDCHLFIGPMGLPIHMAAGLGVDTIHITSVLPEEYDSPEFYHSGWHQAINSKIHCGTYACVTEKTFSKEVLSQAEGPKTRFGFWPKQCPFTENGFSCVHNITHNSLIEKVERWYEQLGKNYI